jgi:hypothetical protein
MFRSYDHLQAAAALVLFFYFFGGGGGVDTGRWTQCRNKVILLCTTVRTVWNLLLQRRWSISCDAWVGNTEWVTDTLGVWMPHTHANCHSDERNQPDCVSWCLTCTWLWGAKTLSCKAPYCSSTMRYCLRTWQYCRPLRRQSASSQMQLFLDTSEVWHKWQKDGIRGSYCLDDCLLPKRSFGD